METSIQSKTSLPNKQPPSQETPTFGARSLRTSVDPKSQKRRTFSGLSSGESVNILPLIKSQENELRPGLSAQLLKYVVNSKREQTPIVRTVSSRSQVAPPIKMAHKSDNSPSISPSKPINLLPLAQATTPNPTRKNPIRYIRGQLLGADVYEREVCSNLRTLDSSPLSPIAQCSPQRSDTAEFATFVLQIRAALVPLLEHTKQKRRIAKLGRQVSMGGGRMYGVCAEKQVKFTAYLTKSRLSNNRVQLNQYTLLSQIYSGAYMRLFEADCNGELLTVKEYNRQRLSRALQARKQSAERFVEMEVEILTKADHPNIARLKEVISPFDSRKTYLILRCSYSSHYPDHLPIPPSQAKLHFTQLISAVSYLHNSLNVVHLGLKPRNMTLTAAGDILISDFGSASFLSDMRDRCIPETPCFTSPERCKGLERCQGKPADVWSLGVTLYYMMCGKAPFTGGSLRELYREIMNGEMEWRGEDEEARDLLNRLLDKDPSTRITALQAQAHPWLSHPSM